MPGVHRNEAGKLPGLVLAACFTTDGQGRSGVGVVDFPEPLTCGGFGVGNRIAPDLGGCIGIAGF